MRRFFSVAILMAFLRTACSQVPYVSFRIDSAVRAAMEQRQIPGLQLAVIKYGLIIKKGNYGMADLESRLPVTDSTMFAIASMSKAFTCAGILLLMEDGKLSIDDTLGKYFDSLPSSWTPVTIRRLMNHTAGLRDDWEEDDNYFFTNKTDSAFFSELKAAPLKFPPGDGFSYGCGPFILGLIIEKVSGETYAAFMKHRIFEKLGMTNSRINDAEAIVRNRAAGYRLKNLSVVHGRQISAAAQARGDVGVLTTVTDMLKWYAALQDSSLLKKSSLDQMFSPGVLNDGNKTPYGFGWFVGPYRDHPLFVHSGGFRTGYNSVIVIYPEDHVCIIILTNLFRAGAGEIAIDIIGLFNPEYGRASQFPRIQDPDTVRTLLLRSFFSELGLQLDSTRRMCRELHLTFYPEGEDDLAVFRNVSEFNFIKSIKPPRVAPDIFGDRIRGVYLYEVKNNNLPGIRYYSFYLDPGGKVVYMDIEH